MSPRDFVIAVGHPILKLPYHTMPLNNVYLYAVLQCYLFLTVDDCRVSQLVLLDLSAASDTVNHQVLLCVLSGRFGISGTALNWFESYLIDRTQSCLLYTSPSPRD